MTGFWRARMGWGLLLPVVAGATVYSRISRTHLAGHPVLARSRPAGAAPRERAESGGRATPERMRQLTRELRERVRHAPARSAAVFVQDIATGRVAAANPDRKFIAASLVKLSVMGAAYDLWERRPELKTPAATSWLEQMVTVSDNACTDRLIDMVGGPRVVTRFCQERGCPRLVLSHRISRYDGLPGLNTCTAREVTRLLVALDRRKLVDQASDEEMWGVLLRQKKRHRIPAGLPEIPSLKVGNKTGTLGFVLHDAGIVHTARARYALCVLLDGQLSDAAGERFCRQVSRLVFDSLHGPVEELPEEKQIARGQ